MLKGHVFKRQVFQNQIFALFINTFLNGQNGVSDNYKNGMEITYSGSTLTINSGAVCIQGRFLEEDTSTSITTGTDSAYCKLAIEIDLDKQNTETEFVQGEYKILKNTNSYPELTQSDIVKNNSGIYQYELARFKTSSSGITSFRDMRTFLDFESIFGTIKREFREVLGELQQELNDVKDGSAYVLKSNLCQLVLISNARLSIPPKTGEKVRFDSSSLIGNSKKLIFNSAENCIEIGEGVEVINVKAKAYANLLKLACYCELRILKNDTNDLLANGLSYGSQGNENSMVFVEGENISVKKGDKIFLTAYNSNNTNAIALDTFVKASMTIEVVK